MCRHWHVNEQHSLRKHARATGFLHIDWNDFVQPLLVLCLHKKVAIKNKMWIEMFEVKLLSFFCLRWIQPLSSPTGILCLTGLIVFVRLFTYLFIHFYKPTQLFCVFHSNAPFRPQLAAPRVGQPAGFWKRRSWEDRAHSVKHSDSSGCWWWEKKDLLINIETSFYSINTQD